MRNFKKAAAFGLAVTMLMGNAVTAFANEGSATGSGEYEGYVERTSVFTVDVPTNAGATAGFNFFVDPNGLLAATDYARISGVDADDFETGASLFFTRTSAAEGETAIATYGKDSDEITFENQSSYAVNVEVSASVTGADGITLGAITDETTAPTIYLALVTPSQAEDSTDPVTTAITADGATVTGVIEGEDSNFEIVYKEADEANNVEAGYYYEKKTTGTLAAWKTYSFHLTGACGGTWTADQAEVAPTVNLTWKVTDPNATVATGVAYTSKNSDGDVTLTFTPGTDAKTLATTSFKINGVEASGWSSYTTNVVFSSNTITVKAAAFAFNSVKSATTDNKYTFTVVDTEGNSYSTQEVVIE